MSSDREPSPPGQVPVPGMYPAPSADMAAERGGTDPGPGRRQDFLLPVLPVGAGPPDPVAIATWHLAVSDALSGELPHDLLALWLFPEGGGVALLGPEGLAEDQVMVPRPDPFLGQEQLLALEDRIRQAGYASVIASPIRDERRDLGLLLLAALTAGRFGPLQAIRLFELLRQFPAPFQRLAARYPNAPGELVLPQAAEADLLLPTLVRTGAAARSPEELLTRLSHALQRLLPHDHLLVALREPRSGRWHWLGQGKSTGRWGAGPRAALPAPSGMAALEERLGEQDVMAVPDLAAERGGLAWPLRHEPAGGPRVHAALVARLRSHGESVGFLLLGSAASDLYRPEDEALLGRVTDAVALLSVAVQAHEDTAALRRTVATLEGPGGAIARAVRTLAATPDLDAAIAAVGAALRELSGATSCRFAIALAADDAVLLEPGHLRPFPDLPLVPVTGAAFAPVLMGQAPLVLTPGAESEELIVPLRVAGHPFGAVILVGPAGGRFASVTLAVQQLADTLAPHLELLRRSTEGVSTKR